MGNIRTRDKELASLYSMCDVLYFAAESCDLFRLDNEEGIGGVDVV